MLNMTNHLHFGPFPLLEGLYTTKQSPATADRSDWLIGSQWFAHMLCSGKRQTPCPSGIPHPH